VRKGDLLITVETTELALEASELFFQYYRENANYLERTHDFVERLGMEKSARKRCTRRSLTRRSFSIG
jgi:nitrite reductase (NADH) large subunit